MTLRFMRSESAGFKTSHGLDLEDNPSPTVMASGIAGGGRHQYWLEDDGVTKPRAPAPAGKPPYRVPTMAEVRDLPWNGFSVVSTFAGGGGSSTGYRMAGFKVLWANEFVEAARDTYQANAGPHTILDGRDIRTVQAEDILKATGLKQGELDLFDGSPPCASFSTAGKREKGWGTVKKYSDTQQRSDDLFFEYVRLLRGLKPKTFVAENVSGLVKGTAKGYFLRILAELKGAGYRVEARVLDAQWLGVPQARQRLIFIGVRDDLGLAPTHPKPLAYRYSVRDALPNIGRGHLVIGDPSHNKKAGSGWARGEKHDLDKPCLTVQANPEVIGGSEHSLALSPSDFPPGRRVVHDTSGLYGAGDVTDRPCPTITVGVNSVNSNHYQVQGAVEPEADMTRFAVGDEWDKLKPGEQSSRYFNLVRPHPDAPCPTVTASGGGASTASVTHPTEKRKFTIAELRRICSFPDDYKLVGTYQQQWERCGRSVPPVMMSHIAAAVRDGVLIPYRDRGGR